MNTNLEVDEAFSGIIHSDNSKGSANGTTHLGEHHFQAHKDFIFFIVYLDGRSAQG
jgi:hypothetical protein